MLARLIAYARGLLTRGRFERELDDELRFHLDQETEANVSRGLPAAEARRRALADLGGLIQTADSVRDVRSLGPRRFHIDLRDALRGLRTGRGTSLLAFGILAITMAAATVTFAVVDVIAIRPLPFGAAERLVAIGLPSQVPGRLYPPSPQDYFDWLDGTRSFESLGAARTTAAVPVQFDGVTELLPARRVTANLFDVLGVRPAAGRFFRPEDGDPGNLGVILNHGLWMRTFLGDPAVIGRRLRISGDLRTVVGVLPEGVSFPIMLSSPPDLYVPYVLTPAERANNRCCIFVVGRIRDGVSVEQARADVQRMSSALVLPLHDQVVGPAKTPLLLVLAAVGFVVLVACANVGSLLLARATARAQEFATREALGASRGRLAFGLILEGLLLALASTAAGMLVSFWGVEAAKLVVPPDLTRAASIAVNNRVLMAGAIAAVLCGLVFASAPAWLSARSNLSDLIKTGGSPVVGGYRRDRLLSLFLVADVAFVSVLLVASTLVVTTFALITMADLGFDRRNVMSIWFQRSLDGVPGVDRPAVVATFRGNLLDQVRSVAGVTDAAISSVGAPMSGSRTGGRLTIPGFGQTDGADVDTREVTAEYFDVMGMRLVRGRLFGSSDTAGSTRVMVINDVASRRFFPGREAIGQVVSYQHPPPGPTMVIGIVQGAYADGPEGEVRPEVYTLLDQQPYHDIALPASGELITVGGLLVRTTGDPRVLAAPVREAIRPALLGREPQATQYVDEYFWRATAGRRFNAGLMATFGLIGVAIGAIGVYGTMAFFVAQQVRAIGLRMALGASPSDVRRWIVRSAFRRVALGVALGLLGAWSVSGALEAFVFGIRPTEPAVYAGVAGFLALVAFFAALVPAMRASRLDPLTALRHE